VSEAERYAAAWRDHRRWTLQFYLSVGTFLGVALIGSFGLPIINAHRATQVGFIALIAAPWLSYVWCLHRLPRWRCPRCGERYFDGLLPQWLRRRCQNCRLPRGSCNPVS
jgi:hypothetical protein